MFFDMYHNIIDLFEVLYLGIYCVNTIIFKI